MRELTDRISPIPHRFVNERSLLGFRWVGGLLLFVLLSGFAAWVLPFSIFSQLCIVSHTAAGVLALAGFAIWQFSHWLGGRNQVRAGRKTCAYVGLFLLSLNLLTGVFLTWQTVVGRYASQWCHLAHLWSSIAAVPFLGFHVWPWSEPGGSEALELSESRRSIWWTAAAVTLILFGATTGLATYLAVHSKHEQKSVGVSDFLPSSADTESHKPVPVETLASSDGCGTSDCHAAIFREWKASAHRWAAEDEFFQEVRLVTTRVKGVQETEKCGACHDPVSMLSGNKDPHLGRSAPGYKEGDSCVVCHAVRRIDERGIGSYALGSPKLYLFESSSGGYGRFLNHFLIRAYPDQHNRDFDLTLLRKPDSCAPCHKEFDVLKPEEGPVQVETQFDDWKRGKWNTEPDPARRLYCQQCHMNLVASGRAQADPYDLKTQLGLKHRNHAFAAGNQYMPAALSAPDAKTQVEQVEQWLRGERTIPEIGKVWPKGPIVELKIEAPGASRSGSETSLKITLANNKVGHSFPTGPLNIARVWLEVIVEDASSNVVFHSGLLDAENHIEAGSYILKPLAMDTSGHMLLKPDLWHPVGPQFRRAILARESDSYEYRFKVPSGSTGPLSVRARLRYAKANQFFMDAVYPDERRQAPITDISAAKARIDLHP